MKNDPRSKINKPAQNKEESEEGVRSPDSQESEEVWCGDLIGAALLSILLGALAALALWLAAPMRFGFILSIAFIISIFLVFKFLVEPRRKAKDDQRGDRHER